MSSKKAKLSSDEKETVLTDAAVWEKVRSHLRQCPGVSEDHPAIQAALQGMEREQARQARDARLQQKFASASTTSGTFSAVKASSAVETDAVVVNLTTTEEDAAARHGKNNSTNAEDPMLSDDWHDVEPTGPATGDDKDQSSASYLGETLAAEAIRLIGQENKVEVSSPLGALALALHASLVSLKFTCTGIPEKSPVVGGFAAPVRPIKQFLPTNWENSNGNNSTNLRLRYRQDGVGAVVLDIEVAPDAESDRQTSRVQVSWATTNKAGTESAPLLFGLEDHINLESWNRAIAGRSKIPPALHYKALSTLLTRFARTFDLGDSTQSFSEQTGPPSKPSVYVQPSPSFSTKSPTFTISHMPTGPSNNRLPRPGFEVPTTMDGAFPGLYRAPGQGDFDRDLHPNLGLGPARPHGGDRFGNPGFIAGGGGSLMGPNHPAFGMGPPGGRFLQPRIDPFGPNTMPGPDDSGLFPRDPRRPRNPNHSHLRPPNDLNNNNMFS